MRDERVITDEIEVKRADLEHDLVQLRALVDDKLDVVRRARSQVDRRRAQLVEARDVARGHVTAHPWLAVGIACAAGALLGLARSR